MNFQKNHTFSGKHPTFLGSLGHDKNRKISKPPQILLILPKLIGKHVRSVTSVLEVLRPEPENGITPIRSPVTGDPGVPKTKNRCLVETLPLCLLTTKLIVIVYPMSKESTISLGVIGPAVCILEMKTFFPGGGPQ